MNSLDPVSKFLILTGLTLIIGGLLWHFGIFNYLKLGRLPGDIAIERPNTKIYIPIVTCLLLSILFSLISMFFRK
ncbi:MAG: DUF2905 domain-containing protein [Chitinophagia bacterium]|nr:DUF2905 domain-containing protein [Chitinophagia bacterium]